MGLTLETLVSEVGLTLETLDFQWREGEKQEAYYAFEAVRRLAYLNHCLAPGGGRVHQK